jgi:hypothetical protein
LLLIKHDAIKTYNERRLGIQLNYMNTRVYIFSVQQALPTEI